MILRHVFEPVDNPRLAHLSGAFDAHLRSIEAALAVRISRREAAFRVDGPGEAAGRALALLQALYEHAARPITPEAVQLALIEAEASNPALRAVAPTVPRRGVPSRDPVRSRDPVPGADAIQLHTRRGDLRGRTPNQVQYLRNILSHDITFGIGPAGTGKTFLAVACAVDALERSSVQRIVLTRPAVEAGERLGFLPGDLTQKVDPYLRPLYDALYDLMGLDRVTAVFEKGLLEVAPLAFMRGRTLNHSFVILDEAQNTTPEQMKMFLTRIGFGSRAVVTGDTSQVDLPRGATSGLADAVAVLGGGDGTNGTTGANSVKGIAFSRFGSADVVRHPLVARIVEAYDAARPAAGAA